MHCRPPDAVYGLLSEAELILQRARTALGEDVFARTMAAGQSSTLERAIAEALRSESFS